MRALLAIAAIFAAAAIIVVALSKRLYNKISSEGIEAVGEVIFVYSENDDTGKERYTPYVSFTDREGVTHEVRLNSHENFPIGTLVRVKYLPGNFKIVNFIDLLDD